MKSQKRELANPRCWRWDGAHPHEITGVEVEDYLNLRRATSDSRGYDVSGEPDVTITEHGKRPGGQCPGCPRCQ